MDSNMFNTSDTNYMELDPKSDLGNVANQAIDDVVKKNNEQYRRNAQMAVELANRNSQNFQKLGSLIKQGGDFVAQAREWNDTREKLKAVKKNAEKQHEETKKLNTKLYNEAVEKSKTIFNFDESKSEIPFSAAKDVKLNATDQKYHDLQIESNKAFKEGVNLAFEADRNYAATDNIDNAEFGIKLFQAASVPDYEERGAALTSQLAKGYEGYLAANQDTKVPTEFGMLSILDAITSKDSARYDAVMAFHQGSYYWSAGVFKGKNALSQRQQIALLKLTDATDKIQRGAFIKDTFEAVKKEYTESRQKNLADAIRGSDNPTEVIFGSVGDPNSGYIAKYQDITGKKDIAGALDLLETDFRALIEKRELDSSDLAKILSMKGIKARDGSGTKTLKEFNEGFYLRIEGLLGQVAEREQRERTSKDTQAIRNIVDSARERLDKVENGADEEHLAAEVKQAKKELRDLDIDVSEGSIYNKYFTPLLNYYTKDDARDEATVGLVKSAVDDGFFKEADNLIKTIKDDKFKKEATDYYEGREPIKNNKKKYDTIKNKLDDYIKKTKGVTSSTLLGNVETNTILANAGTHFNDIFLDEVRKNVPIDLALETAYTKVKANLDMESEVKLKGKNNPNFGTYYVSGAGRSYDTQSGMGSDYQTQFNAYQAGKLLAEGGATKNEWLNSQTAHEGEPVSELLAYTNGGAIPNYYIEASKHLRFMTAQDLMYARLGALGYDKEQKLIKEGSALHKFAQTAEINKMLSYMPNSLKTTRVSFQFDPKEKDLFFDNFVRKTKNTQFGNIGKDRSKGKLDFENLPINQVLEAHKNDGYGYNGFGQYKLEASLIRSLEKASGLDFDKDTLSIQNQKLLIVAKNMRDAGINNFFSTGFFGESGINPFDMEGLFDPETESEFNLLHTLSPELIDDYFEEMF